MSQPILSSLQTAWQQRSSRERRMLALAALVLAVALLWTWGLAPALQTWRMAPQKQAELDLQSRQMLQLQAQARQLQVPARVARQDALALLETTTRTLLGEGARLHIQGDQLRLSLNAVTADALAQWLVLAREKAQALPQQARLQRLAPPDKAAANPSSTEVVWSGELTLRLP